MASQAHSEMIERAHEPKDVDLSAAGRGVWLVKVPKYLSEQWKKCPNGTDVGKLKISKALIPNKQPDIVFTSFDVSKPKTITQAPTILPANTIAPQIRPSLALHKPPPLAAPITSTQGSRDHKFIVTGVSNQNLVVMSQMKAVIDGNNKEVQPEKICVEGKVLHKAECHPIVDAGYQRLKRAQVQAQNTPMRQIKLISGTVQAYKPVSDHSSHFEDKKAKKAEAKRSRSDKEKVKDDLFHAFEKHQFYNVKDLVGITQQPVPYLKEILKEICNYNMTAPHKNMWELKPEFRHYKQADG